MEGLRLQEAVIFLVAAGIVIPIGKRARVSPVLGFLLIGLVVGPFGLGRLVERYPWLERAVISDTDGVRALAELGVVFLLFMIGLELSLERLWAMRRLVLGLGSAQILVTAVVIAGIAWFFGNTFEAALVLGACLALSSTAIVIELLTEQGRFGTRVGQGSFAILLAQDIAVVPILFIVGALGAADRGPLLLTLGGALGKAVLSVAIILGVGRLVLRPMFRFVSNAHSPELFMAATLLIVIATAASTHAAGLSAALGAFLAGLLFAETEFRHEIEVDIEPFKGLLLGLFFMSVGMFIDLQEILANPFWIGASVVGLFAIKATITVLAARAFGFGWLDGVEIGVLLGEGGEFALVVVALAMNLHMVPDEIGQFMLIVVSATMLLTPLAAHSARRFSERLAERGSLGAQPAIEVPGDLDGHVIIAGYGRTGQLIARLLDRQRIGHVALDLDANIVAGARRRGAPVFLGDAARRALLDALRLDQCAALVVTTDDQATVERVVRTTRALRPDLPIVVRATDTDHGVRLLDAGATQVVPEVLEAGLEMARMTLEHAGLPAESARELVDLARAESMLVKR